MENRETQGVNFVATIENKGNVFEIHHLRHFDGVVFSVPDTTAVSIDADSLLYNNWGDDYYWRRYLYK